MNVPSPSSMFRKQSRAGQAAEASRVEWLPVSDLPKLIASGQITDGPSLTALAVYLALPR